MKITQRPTGTSNVSRSGFCNWRNQSKNTSKKSPIATGTKKLGPIILQVVGITAMQSAASNPKGRLFLLPRLNAARLASIVINAGMKMNIALNETPVSHFSDPKM